MSPSPSLTSLLLLLFLLISLSQALPPDQGLPLLLHRRSLKKSNEDLQEKAAPKNNKIPTTTETDSKKNQTKPLKLNKTNSTATLKSKPKSNSTDTTLTPPLRSKSKLNTTTTTTKLLKASNSTRPTNSTAPIKPSIPTTKKKPNDDNDKSKKPKKSPVVPKTPTSTMPWLEADDDPDLITEVRELPSRFHKAVVPDLRKISTTSRAYLTLASKEFTRSFKPLVGTTYAPPLATFAFALLLLLPLALVAALFRHLRARLPLQKVLLSVQIYLAVYFAVLALTAAAAGLEPLRFFHAASPGSYVYTQVLQMLAYVMYLLLLVMNVVVVGPVGLAVAQLAVAVAVGLHYYTAVFHPAVRGEPPRTNWKIHAVYAFCFTLACVLARADRRKKEYGHGEDGDDGKKS